MRASLEDHPKVVAMTRHLKASPAFREWLAPGRQEVVSHVSNGALRKVTTAALLEVWSKAREHGRFDDDDLILDHNEIADLDDMASTPGIGEAMKSVGWALAENGVTLPNFKTYNVPKTNAERQKEHRNKQSEPVTPRNEIVTKVTLPREEKSKSKKPSYISLFENWFSAYPRKAGKGKAKGSWRTAITKIAARSGASDFDAAAWLLEVTQRFAKTPKGTETLFCPYPATWLSQDRYDDDPAQWEVVDDAPVKHKETKARVPTDEEIAKLNEGTLDDDDLK